MPFKHTTGKEQLDLVFKQCSKKNVMIIDNQQATLLIGQALIIGWFSFPAEDFLEFLKILDCSGNVRHICAHISF